MSQYAFVTLLTSESYLPGALVLAAALKDVHQSLPPGQQVIYETVCLVTPETLDALIIEFLRKVFDVVIGVEVLGQPDGRLVLLGKTCGYYFRGTHDAWPYETGLFHTKPTG